MDLSVDGEHDAYREGSQEYDDDDFEGDDKENKDKDMDDRDMDDHDMESNDMDDYGDMVGDRVDGVDMSRREEESLRARCVDGSVHGIVKSTV